MNSSESSESIYLALIAKICCDVYSSTRLSDSSQNDERTGY